MKENTPSCDYYGMRRHVM